MFETDVRLPQSVMVTFGFSQYTSLVLMIFTNHSWSN